MFALLVQALIPAAAMAGPQLTPGDIICKGGRVHTVAVGAAPAGTLHGDHGAFGGMPCQNCLAAAMAAIATPELAIRPVAYGAARVEHAPAIRLIAPRARAPPRPLGQGPPTA